MSLQKIFDFEAIHSLRHSVLDTESVNAGYFILGFMQPQTPHQIFFLFYCEEKREPVLSVSACVEQDEHCRLGILAQQIFCIGTKDS